MSKLMTALKASAASAIAMTVMGVTAPDAEAQVREPGCGTQCDPREPTTPPVTPPSDPREPGCGDSCGTPTDPVMPGTDIDVDVDQTTDVDVNNDNNNTNNNNNENNANANATGGNSNTTVNTGGNKFQSYAHGIANVPSSRAVPIHACSGAKAGGFSLTLGAPGVGSIGGGTSKSKTPALQNVDGGMECAEDLIGYQADADKKLIFAGAIADTYGEDCKKDVLMEADVFDYSVEEKKAALEECKIKPVETVETQTYSAPASAYGASDYTPATTSSYSYAQPAPVDAISCSDVTSLSNAQLKAACGIVETQPAMTQSTGVAQCPVGETYDVAAMKCEPNG